jgi:pSer/pThr/pTyr-binding forkhead associated (FHA) protein
MRWSAGNHALVTHARRRHSTERAIDFTGIQVTIRALGRRNDRPMPFLIADNERVALREGRNTLGGRGPDAVALTPLGSLPPAAIITVRGDGSVIIQRIAAAVIVKVDNAPIGALSHALSNGARLSVGPARLVYEDAATDRDRKTDRVDTVSDDVRAPTDVMPSMRTGFASGRLIELATGCVYPVPRDGLVIGRGAACDIELDGTDVSRRHAFVRPDEQGFTVTDESANGTYVNGGRVNGTQRLAHGDVLGIGTEEFRLDVHSGLSSTVGEPPSAGELIGRAPEPDSLGLGRSRAQPPVTQRATAGTPVAPLARSLAQLEVARGPLGGQIFRVDRPVCALGRGEHNEIRLNDASVSSSHATLLLKRGTWYVVDLQSANGTYVDGYRVATERAISDEGTLRVGDVLMKFRLLAAPREAPSATHGGGGIWRKISRLLSGA